MTCSHSSSFAGHFSGHLSGHLSRLLSRGFIPLVLSACLLAGHSDQAPVGRAEMPNGVDSELGGESPATSDLESDGVDSAENSPENSETKKPNAPPNPVPPDHAEKMKRGLELFRTDIREILTTHCLECHGGDSVKADFNLASRSLLIESGMLDERAESSHLMSLLRHEAEPHMPLQADRLPDEAIELIGQWIDLGAPYDRDLIEGDDDSSRRSGPAGPTEAERNFWSFQPLRVQPPPHVDSDYASWIRNPIDAFILEQLERHQLHPNPTASRRVLIRRAYFDLLGLPPSPDEVAAFEQDPDPQAYERLIDRLLDSPHYGERWARHWMDIARFAESHGYEQDYDRPHAYPYRDFLIQALNNDLPYDQFVKWQIAGDELTRDDPLGLAATGFLGAGAFPTQLTEAEFESARYDELDDMVATLGTAILGISIGCARCHDHKFDPISAEDYYRLASVFTSTIRSEIPLDWNPRNWNAARQMSDRAEEPRDEGQTSRKESPTAGMADEDLAATPEGEQSGGDREPVQVQVTSEGFSPISHHADGRGYPHHYPETYVLTRGDVRQKGEVAEPGFPAVLMRNETTAERWRMEPPEGWTRTSFRRAALAHWIMDSEQGAGHLAARVMVNRLWHHHFGQGIVATPSDFGVQGQRPTHPELLDWLAVDLIHNGWHLKRLHRLIMTSAAYRQSVESDDQRLTLDPENTWLWRRTPRRLEAEAIRDSLLAVSGLLDPTPFGPGTLDANMRRRSIYFFIKRSQLIPMMMLFDWPEHLVGIGDRATTTIAPQALLLMNSPQMRQYAQGLANRLRDIPEAAWIEQAYQWTLGREPTSEEKRIAAQFLEQQMATYREQNVDGSSELARIDFCQALLSLNEFLYVE